MPTQPKRRFLALQVGEVSLVDSPANEVEFLVTKNMEEAIMKDATSPGAGAERVAVEQPAAGDESVSKAMEHVNAIVSNIESIVKNATGVSAQAAAPAATVATETQATDEDVEKGFTSLKTLLTKAGMKGDEADAAMEKLKAAGFDPSTKFPMAQKPAKTAKALDNAAVESLTLDTLSDAITKAKQFTPERIQKLKDALEILKMVIDGVAVGQSPNSTVPQLTTFPSTSQIETASPAPVIKAAGGENALVEAIKSALAPVVTTVQALAGKVEAIEKARPATNSVEGDGSTDAKTTKNGSMWTGVL